MFWGMVWDCQWFARQGPGLWLSGRAVCGLSRDVRLTYRFEFLDFQGVSLLLIWPL